MKKLILFATVSIISISSLTAFAVTKKTSIYTVSEVIQSISKTYTGDIVKIDLEKNDKTLYYEVDILNNDKKTELIIDAKTGKVLKIFNDTLDEDEKYIAENYVQDAALKTTPAKTTQTTPTVTPKMTTEQKTTKTTITEEEAKKIALDKVGGGKVNKIKLDYDDNVVEYDVEVIFGEYEYELEINASTGAITSYEKDHVLD